ncbi:MAG: hypothetical protein C6H99_02605 [Epsilonproteobacteria bacterium]|nr:hypothetical protein [Campylobacterota bacterium]NPA64223.1 lipid-binding SYLF domain-containing protein [Campylobacterota bacterium]
MALPEERIPPKLFKKAGAIAIIPNLVRGGFIVGARYGKGVLLIKNGKEWSDPIFIKIYGGSLGWQIGLEAIDVVLVFADKKSALELLEGKVTLGADLSVAVGPVGRAGQAATDIDFKAKIYSYSRSMGAFAGIALAGAVLEVDYDANMRFYGCDPSKVYLIINGTCKHKNNQFLKVLKRKLNEYSSWHE